MVMEEPLDEKYMPTKTIHQRVGAKISQYKNERGIPVTANYLQWWTNAEHRYPFIAEFVKHRLAIPKGLLFRMNISF